MIWIEGRSLGKCFKGWEEKPENVLSQDVRKAMKASLDIKDVIHLTSRRQQWWALRHQVSTGWHGADSFFCSFKLYTEPVCDQLSIEWQILHFFSLLTPSWKSRCWNGLTSFNWDQISSQLQCTDPCKKIFRSWLFIRFFWLARNRIEYLSNNTSWYLTEPFCTKYLPFVYSTQMADHYGLKITLMTWSTCQIFITANVRCPLFHLEAMTIELEKYNLNSSERLSL